MSNRIERRKRLTLTTWGSWSLWSTDSNSDYTSELFQDTMTDVTGTPQAQHSCSHVTWKCEQGFAAQDLYTPEPAVGQYQYRCLAYKLSPRVHLRSRSSHLAVASGLESLSRARIPAHARADLTGFVSLAEMGQQANSGAARLTAALTQLAYAAYRGRPTKSQKKALKELLLSQKNVKDVVTSLIGVNLEWQFGWKPFIKDIMAATFAFDRIRIIRRKLEIGYRVYGKATDSNTTSGSDVTIGSVYNDFTVKGDYSTTTQVTVTSSIMRRIKNDKLGADPGELLLPIVYDLFGLKPSLSRVWELVPLSFVVDWIYPVGSVLESWEGMSVPQSDWIESFGGLESRKTVTTASGSVSVFRGAADLQFTLGGSAMQTTYVRDPVDFDMSIAAPYVPAGIRIPNTRYWFTGLQLALQRMLK